MNQFLFMLMLGVTFVSCASSQELKSPSDAAFTKLLESGHGLHVYLSNQYVQKNLELTKEQQSKIDQYFFKYNKQYLAVKAPTNLEIGVQKRPGGKIDVTGVRDTPQYKAYEAKRKGIRKNQRDSMVGVLLPHQEKRLMEIVVQKRLHGNKSPFGAYTNEELPALIGGLTANERAALKKQVSEHYENYIAEIAEIKRKYDLRMRQDLPAEKQKRIEELFGELFLWLHTIR